MTDKSDEHVDDLYQDLVNAISKGTSPEAARAELARDQERLFGRYPGAVEDRLRALDLAEKRFLAQQNQVRYLQRRALRFGREQWYLGPLNDDSLWERLLARLKEQERTGDEIDLVDTDSTIVVSLLDNPSKDKFSTKGLVVGHVQSGKTGNMAAVINKAAETPYKFFLVLSGLTDQLRNQTQSRLDSDVVDLASDRWMRWTTSNTAQSNGDFSEKAIGGFSFDHRNQIAVIKKNSAPLRKFLAKLRNTNEATLKNTPFLIIDDECDQASVNSARYATAVTRINDLIRQILEKLPKAAYVGYTATPFANVLIDTTVHADLYPRDFIHALKRPEAYFGAAELFGRHALDGEYEEAPEGFDMIRTVPEDEIDLLRPTPGSAGQVTMTASLERAIRYFTMVVAARRCRGQAGNNTMLVHTSVLNSVHRATEAVVSPYVRQLTAGLQRNDDALVEQLQSEWTDEQERVFSEQFDRVPVSFSQLREHLAEAAASIKVHVENWTAIDRLNYDGGPHTYLVIGGNVLARGLTLDGLSVSYFLRSSSQYDTLMQMGRWFGYRSGFEDLPRVWVEERIREAFFDLATVESEIRRDISRYAEGEETPLDFAVRIRKLPGMTITAPAKMRSAVPVRIGYAGTHIQTYRFHRHNRDWLDQNWLAGTRLIDSITDKAERKNVFRGVPWEVVARFILEYKPHGTHLNLKREYLLDFLRDGALADPRMSRWSVVVVGADGAPSENALGSLGRVQTVVRSAEANSGEDASIKALMSRRDILLDLQDLTQLPKDASWDDLKAVREKRQAEALLLLYPIEAKSAPLRSTMGAKNPRESLDADTDVLGYGIVFPGDKQLSGTYVSANITPYLNEPTDDLQEGDKIPDTVLESIPNGSEAA